MISLLSDSSTTLNKGAESAKSFIAQNASDTENNFLWFN